MINSADIDSNADSEDVLAAEIKAQESTIGKVPEQDASQTGDDGIEVPLDETKPNSSL